ncbi:MAG: fumarylacetoacetate hydrolase family protein, partial [Gemmatimonadaceae bacterium]
MLDATHDPGLHSWVASANDAATEFPVQNLPFGVFARGADVRAGVAIGEEILDLAAAHGLGFFSGGAAQAAEACGEMLNGLMALGASPRRALRAQLSDMLRSGTAAGERAMRHRGELLVAQSEVAMRVPVRVANYTDFYASLAHATNVGSMFRPDNPLLPNYKWVPIGYHGRASSIVVSGTPVLRPAGQRQNAQTPDEAPTFLPSERLDYELEIGLFVGPGNDIGTPIRVQDAGEHLFGLCLLNDWSARDIQAWEYQPLGPFLAKNFATTISPWIVTREALA